MYGFWGEFLLKRYNRLVLVCFAHNRRYYLGFYKNSLTLAAKLKYGLQNIKNSGCRGRCHGGRHSTGICPGRAYSDVI